MIEKTYDFARIVNTMTEDEIRDAARDMELDDLLDLANAGAECVLGQTKTAIANADAVRKAIEADRKKTIKRLRELGEEKSRFAADVLQNEWFDFRIEKKPPTLNSVTKDDLVICSSHVYGVYIGNKYNIPRNRIYSSHDRLHGLMPKRVFVVNEHNIDGSLLQAVKVRFTGRSEVIYITEE